MLLLAVALVVVAFALYTQVPALLIYWHYPWPVYLVFAAALMAATYARQGWARRVVVGLVAVVGLGFVGFTTVLSQLDHPALALRPGDPFPEFTLQTSARQPFSPSQLRGRSAALYVFYRGDW